MGWRETIARRLAPELKGTDEIRAIVAEELKRSAMQLPITYNYDPKGEGYRPLSGTVLSRDLFPMQQLRMFEIAYYMFDASAMFQRLAKMDRGFMFSGDISVASTDQDVQEIITRFWDDPENNMALKYPDRAMWLSILGEQLWPVNVTPANGFVRLQYVDPSLIKEVWVNPLNIEQLQRIDVADVQGRPGPKYAVIRKDYNVNSKTYDRLIGDCFFFSINHPPNSPRGRSDFLTLFDWIDSLERYGYNYLERAEFLLNFVWDVTLKGMNADQIREFLRDNPPPEPGSIRAHNENATWEAVAPDIKAQDYTKGFDMGKAFIMGAAGRPPSWFGEGGKMYQTEADQVGQVPIVDLQHRQGFHKFALTQIIQFVIDQAVIAGRLSPEKAATGFTITMPEISVRDLVKMTNGVPQLVAAVNIAVQNKWITDDEATRIFAYIMTYLGYEIDPDVQIEAAKNAPDESTIDYENLVTK